MEEGGWKDFVASIDLVNAAQTEWEFLRLIDRNHQDLYDTTVIKNAIRRYETVWLPLQAQLTGSRRILPPLDVHWIWHAHMLYPATYKKDCLHIVGKFIDHKLFTKEELRGTRQCVFC